MKEVMTSRGGLATYGEAQVRDALQRGAVNQLLISEGLESDNEKGLVKEMVELAENSRSTVNLISTDTEEGAGLHNAFGGLAAILRYPLN
jgi:peptide chain release factor subunit 1